MIKKHLHKFQVWGAFDSPSEEELSFEYAVCMCGACRRTTWVYPVASVRIRENDGSYRDMADVINEY